MTVKLHGFRYSVYTWIVRLALYEKRLDFQEIEENPFLAEAQTNHPFGKVPTLFHGDFRVYETTAINRYIDDAFEGPPLVPAAPKSRALMDQIIAVADAYVYEPLVRYVAEAGFFAPFFGHQTDQKKVMQGLTAAREILPIVSDLIVTKDTLSSGVTDLADSHLMPMLDYFQLVSQGRALLHEHPALWHRYQNIAQRPAYIRSRPNLRPDRL